MDICFGAETKVSGTVSGQKLRFPGMAFLLVQTGFYGNVEQMCLLARKADFHPLFEPKWEGVMDDFRVRFGVAGCVRWRR